MAILRVLTASTALSAATIEPFALTGGNQCPTNKDLVRSEIRINRAVRKKWVGFERQEMHLSFQQGEKIMKTNSKIWALVASLAFAGTAVGQEKKIKRSELPAAVEKTVAEQSKGATIRGFSEEKENGQTTYEAEMLVNGHTKDVQMDANGAVMEVEEQMDLQALPAEVKAGLQGKSGKGKITKVESITKKDKLVAYEAQVVTDGKKSEVQVGPDGKPLDHEE
jgi:hypothetical protein